MKLIFSLLIVCALIGCTNKKEEQAKAAKAALEAEKSKKQASVAESMKTLTFSQAIFQEMDESHEYGTLKQLLKAGHIDEELATGKKQGYLFKVKLGNAKGESKEHFWSATATPEKPGKTGKRHFFTDQSGVIRFSKDGPANKKSPALGGK